MSSGTCECGHNVITHKPNGFPAPPCRGNVLSKDRYPVQCPCKGFKSKGCEPRIAQKKTPEPQMVVREFPNALRGAQALADVLGQYLTQRVEAESTPEARNLARLNNLCEAIEAGKMDSFLGSLALSINKRYDALDR